MMMDEKGLISQAFAFEKNSQTEAFFCRSRHWRD
jgi:hypothetical protein